MVGFSCSIAVIFGLPLGIFLCITKRQNLTPSPILNLILGGIVNIIRSFPFIILIIVLLPLSRLIIGTSIGSSAAIIPLSIAAIPFIARLFESAFDEVDKGLIEATKSMGASKFTIIKMMIAESMPSLVNAIIITIIGVIGYSAMAGAVGAGGIGDLAMRIGYYSYRADILIYCVIAIILLVQIIQTIGDLIVKYLRKHK
ncbi:methionine ABC transporter permease [Helicobacter sp. MIT 14-3879]|uniref:methionine ABC transporter permease n=1 Tax=Helicobacter sp. MIT 14-3879 TaxID=2040649 RepID=UPI002163B0E9|nr:methionine ABC transporter permease [Helicobacter sp. MIT 14-3879]